MSGDYKDAFYSLLNDLLQDIESETETLKLVYDRERLMLHSSDRIDQLISTSSLGSIVSKIYTKSEDFFSKIAKKIDGDMPDGDGWHASLLRQMKIQTSDRPPVISLETFVAFELLRKFRHVERNSYASDIRASEIPEKVDAVFLAIPLLRKDFDSFSNNYFEKATPKSKFVL